MTTDAGGEAPSALLGGEGVGGRVVLGGAQRAAGFVVANLMTLGGAVILTRHLGVDDFGYFGTVMALLAVVQGIADAGLTMTGTRELSLVDEAERRRELLAHVLGLRIALTAVGVVLAVLFAFVAGYDETLVLGTLIAGFGVFLVSVQSAMLLPLGVEMRNGTIALNEVARQFVLVGGWAVLVIAGASLLPFFAVQLVVGVVMLALTPALLARRHFVAPRWDARQLRALAAIGLPVAISSFLGVIYFRVLVVMMSVLSDSASEVGYYVMSARVIETVTGLPVLLITVVVPVLTVAARDNADRVDYMTARMTEAMMLVGVLIAVVITLAADPIVLVMGGEEFKPAVDVLRIQCLALVTIFMIASWSPALLGMGRVRELAVATGVGVAAMFVLGVALIPPLDATGAAIAAVAADAILCVATYIAVRRAGPGRALDGIKLAKIALAGAAACALILVPSVPDVLLAGAGALLFAGLAVVLGLVPPELRWRR